MNIAWGGLVVWCVLPLVVLFVTLLANWNKLGRRRPKHEEHVHDADLGAYDLASVASREQSSTGPGVPKDLAIARELNERYRVDAIVAGTDLHADIEHGAVTLRGQVCTPHQRARATAIARAVHGVVSVRDELRENLEAHSHGQHMK